MIILFLFLFDKKDFGKKLLATLMIIAILFTIMFNNENFKDRFWKMFFKPLINDPIEMVSNSNYGSHYKVALEVFNNNMIMGVGLKNYRKEVVKDGYSDNASIHPHQTHFEILSETGLLGYFSFLIFFIFNITLAIKHFIKEKNIFQLSGILFVIVSLIPILPSGSFFTSFGAALFWLNFGLMLPRQK
jgi:O-antigen ligase